MGWYSSLRIPREEEESEGEASNKRVMEKYSSLAAVVKKKNE